MTTAAQTDVTLVGATGRTGQRALQALAAQGLTVRAVGRDPLRLEAISAAERRHADAGDPDALRAALAGSGRIVSCLHARFTAALLAAAPETCERLVLTGSTRVFTRLPDRAAEEVRAALAAFHDSGRPGVMLLPTMIYGAAGENNVQRIARLLRFCPFVPLPAGGLSLIQPVHVDDVAQALAAAAIGPRAPGAPVVVAGPQAVTWADFVRAIGRARGRRVVVVPAPQWSLRVGAWLCRKLPGLPPVELAEVQRLSEDKAFDIAELRSRLGIEPRPLDEGLRETFAADHRSSAPASPGIAPGD